VLQHSGPGNTRRETTRTITSIVESRATLRASGPTVGHTARCCLCCSRGIFRATRRGASFPTGAIANYRGLATSPSQATNRANLRERGQEKSHGNLRPCRGLSLVHTRTQAQGSLTIAAIVKALRKQDDGRWFRSLACSWLFTTPHDIELVCPRFGVLVSSVRDPPKLLRLNARAGSLTV
jgi:hypothetical protein